MILNNLTGLPELYGYALITYIAVAGMLWLLHRFGRDDLLLPVSAMNYMLLLTISQYTASKIGAFVDSLVIPMGVFTYSASVAMLDFLTLRFGRRVGYWVVRIAAYLQALVFIINWLVIVYPPAPPFWNLQGAFTSIMGQSARIAIASITAFLISETYDVFLVSRLGGGVLRRVGYSDPVAMTIDTLVFIPTAFYGVVPNNVLLLLMASQLSVKISLVPLTMLAVWINRRALQYGYVTSRI
ncbi:queuosine precursor transporter [Vulcanisaeta distributa]|uniref:queuosine precursor transporter n=1 Tax=Vulcanisaeta distributa TaxID=164451 RepID=UPI0006D1B244|nr:queuosine precursor transporter [Vulcanisaeta distributa]